LKVIVDGVEVELNPTENVELVRWGDRWLVRTSIGTRSAVSLRVGDKVLVSYGGRVYEVERGIRHRPAATAATGEFHAPMPGQIVDVLVEEGDKVEAGRRLLVLEAMKTQQPMNAPFAGIVEALPVAKGQQVVLDQLLVRVVPIETE